MKYAGKLNKALTTRIKGKPVSFTFKRLSGIPQSGDMIMEASFEVGGNRYYYVFDGVEDRAMVNNQKADPSSTPVLNYTIEEMVADLALAYLRELGVPKSEINRWLDLGGNRINKQGDFIVEKE